MNNQIGKWAFIIGIILAILTGFFDLPSIAIVLAILGLIVGFLNIVEKEVQLFLIGVIALLVIGLTSISALNILGFHIADWMETVIGNFITFVAAAGLVVALKAVYQIGKPN